MNTENRPIRIGLTEAHGVILEEMQYPPEGIEYSLLEPKPESFRWIRSPIKGFMRDFDYADADIIESVLSPVRTDRRWVYSIESMPPAAAFGLLGYNIPRSWRIAYLKHLFLADNCKKLMFWSSAGLETMTSYAGITDQRIQDKACVVYPSIRQADQRALHRKESINLLFSGEFFRKGGVHVIDAFERVQKIFPHSILWMCCDEKIDFNTPNQSLKAHYLQRIRTNPGIRFGRLPREKLLKEVLPRTDIYLLPTYAETFGFALLEAMAFGIPVISSNHFAIPEIVEHKVSGYLLDYSSHNTESFCSGYVVSHIPASFHTQMSEQVFQYLLKLIESSELRKEMGDAGIEITRTRFSHECRQEKMLTIYREAMQ